MRIKKTFQTTVPTGKVLNNYTESNVDTYSCNYINEIDKLFGEVIYESDIGKTDNITLEKDISNYNEIEISAKDANGHLYPTQRFNVNKQASSTIYFNSTFNVNGGIYPSGASYNITGTTISLGFYYKALVSAGYQPSNGSQTSDIYITKIKGYE